MIEDFEKQVETPALKAEQPATHILQQAGRFKVSARRDFDVINLGTIEYGDAWKIQLVEHSEVVSAGREKLLVCEHPLVVTLGRVGRREEDLVGEPDNLPVFEVERGGRATMHLPGQLVIYPILDLNRRNRDLHGYMRSLEAAVADTLQEFGISNAAIEPGKAGVWIGNQKICSIGVAVKKWVTFHGLALNVSCDLTQFQMIKPCGFSADVMTSISKIVGKTVEVSQVAPRLIKHLVGHLSLQKLDN